MRSRPLRICKHPGCNELTRDARCPEHAKARRGEADGRRVSPSRRGYTAAWQRLRAYKLRRSPMCEQCGQPGQEVDHIMPLRAGGTNAYENLQTLCKSCHSRKTVAEDGGFGR